MLMWLISGAHLCPHTARQKYSHNLGTAEIEAMPEGVSASTAIHRRSHRFAVIAPPQAGTIASGNIQCVRFLSQSEAVMLQAEVLWSHAAFPSGSLLEHLQWCACCWSAPEAAR